MMQTDYTKLEVHRICISDMEKKMWWGSEEDQPCGKALSCALEEEEGLVEGEMFVAKNIKCQWEAGKGLSGAPVLEAPACQQHLRNIRASPRR